MGEKPEMKGFRPGQRRDEGGGEAARRGQKLERTCLKGTHVAPFKGQKTGKNRPVRGENWVRNRQVKWPRKSDSALDRAGLIRAHDPRLHVGQWRTLNFRRPPDLEFSATRRQGLALRRRHSCPLDYRRARRHAPGQFVSHARHHDRLLSDTSRADRPGAAPEQHLDGVSLVPLLKGGEIRQRTLFWHYPHYGNQGGAPCGFVRDGDWKLIEWYEDGRRELYNLRDDPANNTIFPRRIQKGSGTWWLGSMPGAPRSKP